MSKELPDLPDEVNDIARRLADARPGFTAAELDRIRHRALAGASRRRTPGHTKGIAMRSRALRIVVTLAAFGGATLGGIAAFDVLASAAAGQYTSTSNCTAPSGEQIAYNEYVVIVGGNQLATTAGSAGATIPLTATLEECISGTLTPEAAGANLTFILACTNTTTLPPSAPAGCTGVSYAATSGGASVGSIMLPSGHMSVTFYGGFANTGSPVVIAEGNGIGTPGSSTDPYAGYQEETISSSSTGVTESAAGSYTLSAPASSSVGFTMDGAGGSGGAYNGGSTGAGGPGAAVSGTLNFSGAGTYTVVVGGGGGATSSKTGGLGGSSSTTSPDLCAPGGAGGTGAGTPTDDEEGGGGGGGATCLLVTNSGAPIVVAGGGGGAAAYSDSGGGGGTTISNGSANGSSGTGSGTDGGGGTTVTGTPTGGVYPITSNTGGTGGGTGATGGVAGAAGGAGGVGDNNGGGGGGGGEASGGGGASTNYGTANGGGGGGSSFVGGQTGATVSSPSITGAGNGGSATKAGGTGSVTFTGSGISL